MSQLINLHAINREFDKADDFYSPELFNFISSSIPTFKNHYAYKKIMMNLEGGNYRFKVLNSKLPVFCITEGRDIIIDLNYIDRSGVIHKGRIDIDPHILYEALFFGSLLKELKTSSWVDSKGPSQKMAKQFFRPVNNIITSIYMKLFGKSYGMLTSSQKIEDFKTATALHIGKSLFKINSIREIQSYLPELNYSIPDMNSFFSESSEIESYIKYLSKDILYGVKINEFKNNLFKRMKTFMMMAFEFAGYAIGLFALVNFSSSMLEVNYIKSWNRKAFELLDGKVDKNLF